jgi:hypothetical protein
MAQKNIWERITSETPLLFKRVINISLAASAASVAVLASPWHISAYIHTICEHIAVAGVIAAAVSKTTVVDPNKPTV